MVNINDNHPDKYLNPFTDYGFKKLFGEPVNKALLLDFLNELLKEEQPVRRNTCVPPNVMHHQPYI